MDFGDKVQNQAQGESLPAALPSSLKDRLFVLVALILGFLLFEFILFEGFGISLPVYMTLFYAAVFWYLSGKPGGINRRGLALLLPIALLSACYGLFDNLVLQVLNFLLLFALIPLQLSAMTGNRLYRTFSLGLVIDLFHTGMALPLVNIPAPFRALQRTASTTGKAGKSSSVFIGLAISVPILAVVLGLLSSADMVFERALNGIMTFMSENVMEYIGKIILGAFTAIPLFGLMYALRNNKKISSMKLKINFERVRFIDEGIINTVLVLLNIVYFIFIAVQFGYMLNAFSNILPHDYTYSAYARRGFFELMGVSIINLGVLVSSLLFSKRGGRGGEALLKVMETMLVALTLFLIASAMAKMVMYMDAYGLTLQRVYISWFMLLLAVFFIALVVKLYAKRFALTRFCGIAFITLFLALSFADVDARIAQYNIDNYKSGKFKTVDVEMFYDLSDSMIPYAAVLLDDKDITVSRKANELLSARATIVDDMRWQVFSVARESARRTLIDRGITYKERQYENRERTYD